MIGSTRKKFPRASRVESGLRVLSLAACVMAVVTPRSSAEISLVSRFSDANASASTKFNGSDNPPLRRTLTFAERAAYQYAIEEVYGRHRIWPRSGGENPGPKPPLDAIVSPRQIEHKVEEYLRKSQLIANERAKIKGVAHCLLTYDHRIGDCGGHREEAARGI